MRKLSLSVLFLAAPVFAQLPSQTVTITASRSLTVPPDQAVLSLTVTSDAETNLDQIVSPLSGLGITPLNLTGVDNSSATLLQWNFSLAVPFSSLTATIASLTNLEQNITKNNSGLTLGFSVTGVQTSAQSQASQQAQTCSNDNLIGDATAQAQKLASAAGMTLGPVRQISTLPQPTLLSATVARLGAFVPVSDFLESISYSSPVSCSLSVQFQLLP